MNKMTFDNYPDILKPSDIMDILQIGRSTCYNLLYSGSIPTIRIGKQYSILKKELIKYLNESCSNHTD